MLSRAKKSCNGLNQPLWRYWMPLKLPGNWFRRHIECTAVIQSLFDFGTNRKRVRDFPLVISSNLGSLGSETAVLWQDWSQTGLGLGLGFGLAALVLVLVLVLDFWSCLKHCCARQALCDKIMLKCNKQLYFFRAVSAETVPNVTGHHISFWRFFAQSYFLITNMRVASCNRRVFFVM